MESVENLSTISVDKSEIAACFVESVEKISTFVVDKWKIGKKRKKITRISTFTVDNLVENCAEVCMIPESGSILPQSKPGYRTFPGKCQVNWLPDIFLD